MGYTHGLSGSLRRSSVSPNPNDLPIPLTVFVSIALSSLSLYTDAKELYYFANPCITHRQLSCRTTNLLKNGLRVACRRRLFSFTGQRVMACCFRRFFRMERTRSHPNLSPIAISCCCGPAKEFLASAPSSPNLPCRFSSFIPYELPPCRLLG